MYSFLICTIFPFLYIFIWCFYTTFNTVFSFSLLILNGQQSKNFNTGKRVFSVHNLTSNEHLQVCDVTEGASHRSAGAVVERRAWLQLARWFPVRERTVSREAELRCAAQQELNVNLDVMSVSSSRWTTTEPRCTKTHSAGTRSPTCCTWSLQQVLASPTLRTKTMPLTMIRWLWWRWLTSEDSHGDGAAVSPRLSTRWLTTTTKLCSVSSPSSQLSLTMTSSSSERVTAGSTCQPWASVWPLVLPDLTWRSDFHQGCFLISSSFSFCQQLDRKTSSVHVEIFVFDFDLH